MFSHANFRKYALAVCLLSIVSVPPTQASMLPASTWQRVVSQNALTLQQGDYNNSLKSADRILSQMLQHLGSGSAEDEILGTVIAQKALASAGLGKIDQALWYWYVAQAISPATARTDLSPFGAPGEFLKRHSSAAPDTSNAGASTPARILKQVAPEFPSSTHLGDAVLIVRVVIDQNGQPTQPHIIHLLPSATCSFAALEALKHWQFAPGKRNGEAVSSRFDLTLHYKL